MHLRAFERDLGGALWEIRRASLESPVRIHEIRAEHDLTDNAIVVLILVSADVHRSFEFRLDVDAIDMGPGLDSRQLNASIVSAARRVNEGWNLYSEWDAARRHMIEAYDRDRLSPACETSFRACDYMEDVCRQNYPEADRWMIEEIRRDYRYREIFASLRDRFREIPTTWDGGPGGIAPAQILREYPRISPYLQNWVAVEASPYATFRMVGAGGGGGVGYVTNTAAMEAMYYNGRHNARYNDVFYLDILADITGGAGGGGGAAYIEAQRRAEDLLLEHLSPAQKEQMDKHSHFEVLGGATGTRYRICKKGSINIDVLTPSGGVVRRLCFAPRDAPHIGDIMLAQKVMLEMAEEEALKVAHVHAGDPGISTEPLPLRLWERFMDYLR